MRCVLLFLVALAAAVPACAQQAATFNAPSALAGWSTAGDAAIDAGKGRDGAGGALRIGPGGKAIWKLRDTNGAGEASFWVFDDGTKPADAKARRVGPRWGLIQTDGRVLVTGALYAPYLAGATTYAASDSDQKNWFNVQYLGLNRSAGWHQWTFRFDPEKGLSILYDGKDVNAQRPRFDWNRTQMKGFCGVAFFGDAGPAPAQTIWVDDLQVTLGGAMAAVPTPPPPPAPVVPEADPAPAAPAALLPAVAGKHPRLLFSAEQVPALRKLAAGEGKPFWDQVEGYLGSCKAPADTKFQTDATDGQRQGLWRLPTVALHYVIAGDRASFDNTVAFMRKLMETDHWETGEELDCGMSAANIMVGAALAYDWLYNDLDPQFREAYRKKLLLQARRMYYGGHLQKQPGTHYWQQDPQNNHRWHRDAGLTLCTLAVAGDGPGWEWILSQTLAELEFVTRWLPDDGTSHESPSYMVFGMSHLVLACDAADRCLGTRFLEMPFFKSCALVRMQTLAPGLKDAFCYGDAGGTGFYNSYAFRCAAANHEADLQAGLQKFYEADKDAFMYGWFSLVWYDAGLKGGDPARIPKDAFFSDLGLAFMRDGWDTANAAAMFKCAPYGGYTLNRYRNENQFHYINVAHDDPDANMFVLWARGGFPADDDRYAGKKLTAAHNTILVNGKGQKGEGSGWTQPQKGDMTGLANVLAWKSADGITATEGEAGAAYNGLSRYRRTFLWAAGDYVLVLDDIRAPADARITWLVQGPDAAITDDAGHRYRMGKAPAACDLAVASDTPFAAEVTDSPAENHGKPLGYRQLRLSAAGKEWRLASAFDLWARGKLAVTLKAVDENKAEVTVSGPGIADTWTWEAAPDNKTPSMITCRRQNGKVFQVGPADKAEQ